ncbi:MAG: hypothetical protein ACOCXM_08350 [Myxococcota bacterium]
MVRMLDERRTRRSEEQQVALRYQLEHAREQGGLQAMVLADGDGLSVVASGDPAFVTELAAMAPLMGSAPFGMPLSPLLRGVDVAVRPLMLNGQTLYLATAGGGMARDAVITHSVQGVTRILASN